MNGIGDPARPGLGGTTGQQLQTPAKKGRPALKLNLAATDIVCCADGAKINKTRLRAACEGSTLFHGSRSASLLFATPLMGDRAGHLLPMGELLGRGICPFSGECGNALDKNAFNAKHLSTVELESFGGAYDYATAVHQEPWKPEDEQQRLVRFQAERQFDFCRELQNNRMVLSEGRLALWDRLDATQRWLVEENFPVIYGFSKHLGDDDVVPAHSDIAGEFGIRGGARPEDIRVVFVPSEYVQAVQDLLRDIPGQPSIYVKDLGSFKEGATAPPGPPKSLPRAAAEAGSGAPPLAGMRVASPIPLPAELQGRLDRIGQLQAHLQKGLEALSILVDATAAGSRVDMAHIAHFEAWLHDIGMRLRSLEGGLLKSSGEQRPVPVLEGARWAENVLLGIVNQLVASGRLVPAEALSAVNPYVKDSLTASTLETIGTRIALLGSLKRALAAQGESAGTATSRDLRSRLQEAVHALVNRFLGQERALTPEQEVVQEARDLYHDSLNSWEVEPYLVIRRLADEHVLDDKHQEQANAWLTRFETKYPTLAAHLEVPSALAGDAIKATLDTALAELGPELQRLADRVGGNWLEKQERLRRAAADEAAHPATPAAEPPAAWAGLVSGLARALPELNAEFDRQRSERLSRQAAYEANMALRQMSREPASHAGWDGLRLAGAVAQAAGARQEAPRPQGLDELSAVAESAAARSAAITEQLRHLPEVPNDPLGRTLEDMRRELESLSFASEPAAAANPAIDDQLLALRLWDLRNPPLPDLPPVRERQSERLAEALALTSDGKTVALQRKQ